MGLTAKNGQSEPLKKSFAINIAMLTLIWQGCYTMSVLSSIPHFLFSVV